MSNIIKMPNKYSFSIMRALPVAVFSLFVAGCSPELDMQGYNPQEYYKNHPIKNTVEERHTVFIMDFHEGTSRLSESEKQSFKSSLKALSPNSVDAITIRVSSKDNFRKSRIASIKNILRKSGYKTPVQSAIQEKMPQNRMIVSIEHLSVVTPRCPDWRLSPVTTYGNTAPANYGCASTVNFGLMVEDPHDLLHGRDSSGSRYIERDSKALYNYKTGETVDKNSSKASLGGS